MNQQTHLGDLKTAKIVIDVCPTLLFARRIILQAFHDAQSCRDGRPTREAWEAYQWIMARTDWTLRHCPPPPADYRKQFLGSFEWACRWLGEVPDTVRAKGLPNVHCPGRSGGISQIVSVWDVARQQWISSGGVETSGQMCLF